MEITKTTMTKEVGVLTNKIDLWIFALGEMAKRLLRYIDGKENIETHELEHLKEYARAITDTLNEAMLVSRERDTLQRVADNLSAEGGEA